jgi:hypothetical protein
MKASTKASAVRIAIPLLRLFPTYSAVVCMSALYQWGFRTFIVYAAPLQKVFFAPIVLFIWGALALVPFIVLRSATVFYIYAVLLFACLTFMAYDRFVPFNYVSADFHGEVQDPSGSYSTAGNDERVDYWISRPTVPHEDDLLVASVRVAPLLLAFVYRRWYPRWINVGSDQ